MSKRTIIRVVGWAIVSCSVLLLVETGNLAAALGTDGPFPQAGASDASALEFWRQLTFIRMFAVSMIGLAGICFWSARTLTERQRESFLTVLFGVFTISAGMAVVQQVGIWNRGAGWAIVGVLGALAVVCLAGAASRGPD
jgi:hypothetical protein